jgi:hypothetical protein
MTLSEMIVCSPDGRLEQSTVSADNTPETVSLLGSIMMKENEPFYFYAVNSITAEPKAESIFEVLVVMPLGGKESGLFRQPRIGERVLVGKEGGHNYLMGYVPTEEKDASYFFTATKAEEKAEVFRYKQTGRTDNKGGAYSEIGFYHAQTAWKASDKGGENKNYADNGENHDQYPKIDRVNIQSTGDLRQTAANHQLLMSKRLEILANCEEVDYTTGRTKNTGDLPLGDNVGENPELFSGDIQIRAGNRVIIKAAKEIRLQVGRTVLTISDSGLKVLAKLFNSLLTNPLDTVLDVVPRKGITLFGRDVTIGAQNKINIGDSMGGSLSSALGVTKLTGRQITIQGQNNVEYQGYALSSALTLIQVITSGVMINQGGSEETIQQEQKAQSYLKTCFDLVEKIQKWKLGWDLVSGQRDKDVAMAQKMREEAANAATAEFLKEEARQNKERSLNDDLHIDRLRQEGRDYEADEVLHEKAHRESPYL